MNNTSRSGASEHEVKIDGFLFSCLEFEKTQKARGFWPQTVKWPPLTRMHTHPQELDKDIAVLVKEMIEWYANENSAVREQKVALENLHAFTALAVDLIHDISELHYKVCNEEIPSPTDPDAQHLWIAFDKALGTWFPSGANLIKEYASWNFRRPEQFDINLSSLPPVGRNTPPAGSRISSQGYLIVPERNGGRGRNGNGGAQQGGGVRRNGQYQQEGRGGDRGGNAGGGRRPQQSGAFRGEGQGPKRFGRGDKNNNRRPNPISQAERERLEAEALKSVITAIDQLRSNADLKEVRLNPTNSFLRRMQHNEVSSHGFFSHSVGEDKERVVVVTRTEQNQAQ